MRLLSIATLLLLFAGAAQASTPTGGRHGPWHVTSISSISGVAGGDAMAILVQENEGGRIGVDWLEGGDVVISFRVQACQADGSDFLRTSRTTPRGWAHTPASALARRLEGIFAAWHREARRACLRPARVEAFRFDELATALADFTDRLRHLAALR